MTRRPSSILFAATTFWAALALSPRAFAHESAVGESVAPYFYVAGGDPKTDRLPLESMRATVQIAGAIARVRYQQRFKNAGARPLEAVYVFPASTRVAVHEMRMKIGTRTVEARIDRKDRAQAAFGAAKAEGKRAALLEQERANVFRTRVANVMPGDVIEVELCGSELLVPEGGVYSLVVPGVVGPRYGGGAAPETSRFIATPYLPAGVAASYDWDVRVRVETGGVPVSDIDSPSHDVAVVRAGVGAAEVALTPDNDARAGDRDFVLRYRLGGGRIETGLSMSPPDASGDGFFAVLVEPPKAVAAADVPPREYVFLVDVSGSMHGFPLDTAKALMRALFATLRPADRFNVVLFSGAAYVLAPTGSLPATEDNLARAQRVLEERQGGGATELQGGLERAYAIPRAVAAGSRTVVVVTDGYVGVEAETFRFVRERLGEANAFAFGIGSGVNRALIEGLARAGSGEPFVVTKPEEALAAAEKLRAYIDRPLLSRVQVDFEGLEAFDVAPARQPDLMAERPLVVFGKFRGQPKGRVVVRGVTGQGPWRAEIAADAGRVRGDLAALRWLWARKQAEWIEDERAIAPDPAKDEALAALGLRYGLSTSMTSFVAIDDVVANAGGAQDMAVQPLPLPRGVSSRAVASLSRTEMPPGDPILTVQAPPDARLVTAHFPFGLVKELRYDAMAERWQTRFLVPKHVKDGTYKVPVVIVRDGGRTDVVEASYRIDSRAPDFEVDVAPAAGGVSLRVRGGGRERLRAVTAALVDDGRVRVDLSHAADDEWTGFIALPPGWHRLRVVAADEARNEGDEVVSCEVSR